MWRSSKENQIAKEQADKAGQEIIRAATLEEEEVGAIASSPFLYRQLRARIEAEREQHDRQLLPVRQQRGLLVRWGTVAVAALVVIAIAAVFRGQQENGQPLMATGQGQPTIINISPFATQDENAQQASQGEPPATLVAATKRFGSRPERAYKPRRDFDEDATTLIPLTLLAQAMEADTEQVVRIEMPRANLRAWGLPVNPERANEIVEAEVVISNGGITHAIRILN